MVLIPAGLVLMVLAFTLVLGIAKDGSPFRRSFWTA